MEKDILKKLKANMKKHGFNSVSGFIRYIIVKFFDKQK